MKKKALLIASTSSGHGRGLHFVSRVAEGLRSSYDELSVFLSPSLEEGKEKVVAAALEGSEIIILGGDGTFNAVINDLAPLSLRPTLGYVNAGTLGDVGRNFGVSSRVGKAIKIIRSGHLLPFDVVEARSREKTAYFAYMMACGIYSEIPYVSKGYRKALLGRFDYYRLALADALKKSELRYSLASGGTLKEGKSPFLLFLNGERVAGFHVNRTGDCADGKFEAFLAEPGAFNGLLHYLSRKKLFASSFSSCRVEVEAETLWCLDGEPLLRGSLDIKCVPQAFRVYSDGN